VTRYPPAIINIVQLIFIFRGAEGGLRLLLNVEQYEYMPGPNQGAGVRIHIHDQQEVPLMKDFGLAVAPGTHSLIGMTMNKVKNAS